MTNNYDYLFKYIVIGDSNVGKSCIMLRFTESRYKNEHEPTLGVQFGSKNIKVSDLNIKVQIWDTAGQDSFRSITRSYYRGSIVAIIVYDISKRDSFDNVNRWLHEVKNHSNEKVQILLVGNKCDLSQKREVTREEAQSFAKKNGFLHMETSAQSGFGVEEVFKTMAAKVLKMIASGVINPVTESNYGIRPGKNRKTIQKIQGESQNDFKLDKQKNEQPASGTKKPCC